MVELKIYFIKQHTYLITKRLFPKRFNFISLMLSPGYKTIQIYLDTENNNTDGKKYKVLI